MDDIKPETIRPIVEANIVKEARLYTDESSIYNKVSATFADLLRAAKKRCAT